MEGTTTFGLDIMVKATAAAGLAKTGVDVIRTQGNMPSWVSPVAAFFLSLVILVCLFEASGIRTDVRQNVFTVILGAFIAMPLAIGATAVQSVVERRASDRRIADVASVDVERAAGIAAGMAAENVAQTAQTIPAHVIEDASRRGAQTVIDELRAEMARQAA